MATCDMCSELFSLDDDEYITVQLKKYCARNGCAQLLAKSVKWSEEARNSLDDLWSDDYWGEQSA